MTRPQLAILFLLMLYAEAFMEGYGMPGAYGGGGMSGGMPDMSGGMGGGGMPSGMSGAGIPGMMSGGMGGGMPGMDPISNILKMIPGVNVNVGVNAHDKKESHTNVIHHHENHGDPYGPGMSPMHGHHNDGGGYGGAPSYPSQYGSGLGFPQMPSNGHGYMQGFP
ncbi:hypothetical protein OESDEN_09250 [Oesophagostomum dentatum]|uniref:Uncharacterized protein n=1 Tax=Oesophagostomum dentatum TaxID=61180 RepID=A0A0B1T0X4_OESDE|nr:hypothetical protein OESDEN_09250 [Oesophagostomum dentatum]